MNQNLPKASLMYFDKKQLIACVKHYQPQILGYVDKILEHYKGREDEMFQYIRKAYGVNPTKPWLIKFYKEHNPEKINNIDSLLNKYKSREDHLYLKLSTKYSQPTQQQKQSLCTAVAPQWPIPAG